MGQEVKGLREGKENPCPAKSKRDKNIQKEVYRPRYIV